MTLNGSIDYYRDLPLAGDPVFARIGAVPGLIVGSDHTIGEQELYRRTAELLPAPSRALMVQGAGHWPHREKAAVVVPELLRFLAEIPA